MHLSPFFLALLLTLFVVMSTAMNSKPDSSKQRPGKVEGAKESKQNHDGDVPVVQPISFKELISKYIPVAKEYTPESSHELPRQVPVVQPISEKEAMAKYFPMAKEYNPGPSTHE